MMAASEKAQARQKRTLKTTSCLQPPSWKMAEMDWGSLEQSQTIEQQRKTTRPTRKTHEENYFRFGAAILENG